MEGARHFILATAGHVDHGKSALVKALTGTDPDRLPEEQLRGITIDLGFAHLELPSTAGASSIVLGIVDVPGHEDFVKNMVAGVGSIDLSLLVVAADDGWMPQTEEHLQILTYLGVKRAVVALTKIDLAQNEQSTVAAIREKLKDTPLAGAPIVPTSVVTGRGIGDVKTALAQVLADAPAPADIGKPRLPVDRVFKLQGIGTVVTGTLSGGILRRGQNVVIQPSAKAARIRSIQSHNRDLETSGPGSRTALNLSLDAVEDVRRGDVITFSEFGGPSTIVDALLEISQRAARPVKDGARLHVHHGSGNTAARIAFHNREDLAPGQRAAAQLRMEEPAFVFAGDRFVLRDWSEHSTLGGGIVLDPDASRRLFHNEARAKFLSPRAQAPDDAVSFVASQLARDGGAKKSQMLRKSRFSADAVAAVVSRLQADGSAMVVGETVIETALWKKVRQRAVEAIDARHRAHSEQAGLPLTDLRAALELDAPVAEIFDAIVADLCAREFTRSGNAIRRVAHRPALSPQLQSASARIRAMLAAKPFDPPSRKDVAPDIASQQALRFLIESGEVFEVSSEIVLAAESAKGATEMVREFIRSHGPATVSELRQMLGTSRRVALPLLERLDRDGVTLRQGDKRSLRQPVPQRMQH
jgi:selenocysteine-specific elongation factor